MGKTFESVSGGTVHTEALGSNGTVYSWGYGPQGQNAALPFASQAGIKAIAAGHYCSLYLKSDGKVFANSRIGPFYNNFEPDISGITVIAGGGVQSLLLKPDGTVYEWRMQADGAVPEKVNGLSGIIAIAGG